MRQPFYEVSLFKAMDRNVFGHSEVWEFVRQYSPDLKILYLERENILYQAVSCEINRLHRQGDLPSHPTRTFTSVRPEPCELDPVRVLQQYRWIEKDNARNRECLAETKVPTLYLSYEEVVTMDIAQSSHICGFLGVHTELLHTDLKKVHIQPYEDFVINWAAIEEVCSETVAH